MKIINRIVEVAMTTDEQVELMRLEDEVCQARDEYDDAIEGDCDELVNKYYSILNSRIDNLNKYIERITKEVMARI